MAVFGGPKGQFMEIDKEKLILDPKYQRGAVAESKIAKIATDFRWAAFGVVSVARRDNGRYYVMDAANRMRAALRRPEIRKVPCLVFDLGDEAQEAMAFRDINCNRTQMQQYHDWHALFLAGDDDAVAVNRLAERANYEISPTKKKFAVPCVGTLMAEFKKDLRFGTNILEVAFGLTVEVADGASLSSRVLRALCRVERFLHRRKAGSLLDQRNVELLTAATQDSLLRTMDANKPLASVSRVRSDAQAIIDLCNRRRRRNKLPDLMADANEKED